MATRRVHRCMSVMVLSSKRGQFRKEMPWLPLPPPHQLLLVASATWC